MGFTPLPDTPPAPIPPLADAIEYVRGLLPDFVGEASLAVWKDTATSLRVYAKQLTAIAGTIEGVCAEAIPRRSGATVTSDARVFARTGERPRTYTKDADRRADLQRLVLDTRIEIPKRNPKTGKPQRPVKILGRTYEPGEVVDLGPAERILWVYPLDEPRKDPLRLLGIDPDDCPFFTVGEWTNSNVKEVDRDDEPGE